MQKYKMPISRLRMMVCLIEMLLPMCMFAQQITVQGIVKDQTGETVIGASVMEKGTTNGTITGIDGDFSLNMSSNGTLVVSFVGYKTQEVQVKGQKQLQVVLSEDAEMLDEVVVIGYGTMKKSDLTGAVSSIGNKDIKDSPVSNLGQAIQGKISGVQIVDAGKPGDNVSIKIRGLGSINNCDPLVVIDGVPTDLGLSSLNMADVERLDVLKDASATAIYGSRGANGVVMITTKRGTEGKGKLAVSANYSFQNATNVPSLLNAAQYAELSNDMMVNSGRNPNPEWANPSELGAGTDWMDELLRTGVMQNYTVSYSGGNEKSHYYVSGGFLDQSGIVKSVNYRRFTFQSNSDAQVLKWLKFSNNITFSADTKKSGSYNIGDALKALPIYPVKNEDGSWSGPDGNSEWYGSTRNPIGPTELNKSQTDGYNFLANLTAELTFTKWLKFKSTFGYDAKFWFIDNFTPKYNWKPTPTEETSRYKSDNKSFTYLWDNYFLFDHTFAEKHRVGLMAGMSAQWNTNDYLNAQKNVFMFDNVHEMDNGEKMYAIGGNETEWALLSYMARVNYSYEDRYLLTATIRRDGSSRFGKKHRWGTFPSVSVAWRASQEKWFPKNDYINDLKVRAGYGVTGSQASVGNYSYLASYNTSVYPFGISSGNQTALVSSTLANPYIHWEEVAQTNIGFDASLFNSRVMFSFDAYLKETRDMLVKASIPITSGFEDTTTTYTNAGKVRNQGIEMSLHTINLTGELGWETNVTATYNKNKIKDLNSDVPYYINQINNSYVTMLAKDYPINVFYGYVTDGIFQNQSEVNTHAVQPGAEPGDIRFRDLNNDGVINDSDRTVIGNPNPSWLFSMNNSLSYKGFELSVFLQGIAGNKIYNANNIDNTGMAAAYNQTTDVLKRWQGEGTSNSMPRAVFGDPNQNTRVSDRFVENGSYLRLKNITLSYTFPKQWLQKAQIENARLSLSCENVATITGYSGFDPEVGINGIDQNRYPISRTFSLGLNFNF
ncbi:MULTISPECIES: SusC/RagA family TonB-linked outer membrane protein [Bacteroides]|uniref:TonB-dependent receptor n=1 Tax=Bacteroides uniformis TaxID=820 RepID=A0A412BBR1_BACUN|nr:MULTISPECIES: TonB-dependent receptor [Bacteroides]RGJ50465.1 TonB-dependent receptor [Bacteroides sp. D20]RGQ51009.1 TonB-dependent receptor [Bacteroides uniformis]